MDDERSIYYKVYGLNPLAKWCSSFEPLYFLKICVEFTQNFSTISSSINNFNLPQNSSLIFYIILETENIGVENHCTENSKFSWEEAVKSLLEKANGEISLKKITKKMVAEYQSCFSDNKSFEEISKKFNKKLSKLPFVEVGKDRVYLRT